MIGDTPHSLPDPTLADSGAAIGPFSYRTIPAGPLCFTRGLVVVGTAPQEHDNNGSSNSDGADSKGKEDRVASNTKTS